MSHIRMSHVTQETTSCQTYEWVMSHMWRSHVPKFICEWTSGCMKERKGKAKGNMDVSCHTYMNESRHTYEWVTSHMWMNLRVYERAHKRSWRLASHLNEPCLTLEWVMSHMWMSHVPQVNPLTEEIRLSLDLKIRRFSRRSFALTGTPFTHVKPCIRFWGLPQKRVWYVRGLLWKLAGNFGSRNYFKSDLLRLWEPCPTFEWVMSCMWMSQVPKLICE